MSINTDTKNFKSLYWKKLHSQLISQKEINSFISHQGEKGLANEDLLKSLLSKFLPYKYQITSGILIDKEGKQSPQKDIIIYDTINQAKIFQYLSETIFPLDLTLATIEVKTTLDRNSISKAIESIRKTREMLTILEGNQIVPFPFRAPKHGYINVPYTFPVSIIFAYQLGNFNDIGSLLNYIRSKCQGISFSSLFDLIFIIEKGYLIHWSTIIDSSRSPTRVLYPSFNPKLPKHICLVNQCNEYPVEGLEHYGTKDPSEGIVHFLINLLELLEQKKPLLL